MYKAIRAYVQHSECGDKYAPIRPSSHGVKGLSAKSIQQKTPPRHVTAQVGAMTLVPASSAMSVGRKSARGERQYFCKLQMFEVLTRFCSRFFHSPI